MKFEGPEVSAFGVGVYVEAFGVKHGVICSGGEMKAKT